MKIFGILFGGIIMGIQACRLEIITENQKDKNKAEKLYLEIIKILDNCSLVSIEKYYKFENSYKITININIDKNDHYNDNILTTAYNIASP